MKVYAFIGRSGTGKSQKALSVANDFNIDIIIDDGLLIKNTKVISGYSAKKERTKIGAVKRALFMEPDHASMVKEAIKDINPPSILILGTSENMIQRITEVLALPHINKRIFIEDVCTEEEIEFAIKVRNEQGKHVIPVPTFEIKKDFSGYFIDPLRIFQRRSREETVEINEKTVVRPTYSYLGSYYINDTAVNALVLLAIKSIEGIIDIKRVDTIKNHNGVIINIDVVLKYGFPIMDVLGKAQEKIIKDVEYMTGLNVLKANITAKGLVL